MAETRGTAGWSTSASGERESVEGCPEPIRDLMRFGESFRSPPVLPEASIFFRVLFK